MLDILKDAELHHRLVEWSDPSITADSVSRVLLGHPDGKKPQYWSYPEFEGMEPHEIERQILFEAGRVHWGEQGFYGKLNYQHMLMLIKLMFPATDITPSLADAVMFFCLGLCSGRKMLNLIGSQNSSKSASAARLAFACMYIDPEFTVVYVANPFDNAADATVWGDIEELWSDLVDTFPSDHKFKGKALPSIFPLAAPYENNRIEFIRGRPKSARMVLRNVKGVGKYKGNKTVGKQPDRGLYMVIVDEVNEIKDLSYLTVIYNLQGLEEFFCITSQNFKDETDMGGRLTEPDGSVSEKFGRPQPINFDELNMETDMFWYSRFHSITLRFDGYRSPNIMAKRVIYRYLFKQTDLDRFLDDGGEQTLDFYSQVRSFPVRGAEINSLLSSSKVSISRHTDPYYRLTKVSHVLGFCDPAFGGRDKAVWGSCKIGTGYVSDAHGTEHEQDLMVFEQPFKPLALTKGAIYNDFWFDRLTKLGVDLREFPEGSAVTFEHQIAIQCLELNEMAGVPAANFGYDYSMRADIGPAMSQIIGYSSIPFDYRGEPEGVHLLGINQNSADCCKNRLTELGFLAADFFISKQVRGGGVITAAVMQLSRTTYELTGKKYLAQDKPTYKAKNQQVSPDHRDVLMGLGGLAARRGFRKGSLTTPQHSGGNVFTDIQRLGIGRSRTALHMATR